MTATPRASCALAALTAALLLAAPLAGQAPAAPPAELVFVGVHVVPMDRDTVLHDQTVLVRGGRIVAVGPRLSVPVPAGAREVEAAGRYLLPGLADMHVHLVGPRQARWLVAHGVTTVRNLWGLPMLVRWRDPAFAPEIVRPYVHTTGPVIDGDPPVWEGSVVLTDPAAAAALVRDQREVGYEALKVYVRLTSPVYEALVAAAALEGMPVVGHVPEAVGVERALAARQRSIEHLNGYPLALRGPEHPPLSGPYGRANLEGWVQVDTLRVREMVRRTVEAGTWNVPTLITRERLTMPLLRADSLLALPVFHRLSPELRGAWRQRIAGLNPAVPRMASEGRAQRLAFVRALHDAGAGLLLGTDAGNPFILHGYSVYEELELFVEAGLTPYQALRTATAEAARFLGAEGEFGTVAVGRRADLILLGADPLEDVRRLRRPLGVVLRGHWYPAAELEAMLEWQPPADAEGAAG